MHEIHQLRALCTALEARMAERVDALALAVAQRDEALRQVHHLAGNICSLADAGERRYRGKRDPTILIWALADCRRLAAEQQQAAQPVVEVG
jgi:hypothetical protein